MAGPGSMVDKIRLDLQSAAHFPASIGIKQKQIDSLIVLEEFKPLIWKCNNSWNKYDYDYLDQQQRQRREESKQVQHFKNQYVYVNMSIWLQWQQLMRPTGKRRIAVQHGFKARKVHWPPADRGLGCRPDSVGRSSFAGPLTFSTDRRRLTIPHACE